MKNFKNNFEGFPTVATKNRIEHLFQRLALSIQKGNAALILSRSTDIHQFDMLGEF